MRDFQQWLPQSQNTADLYFSSILMPPQFDTSIETQTRTSAVVPLENESALLFGTRSDSGPIEGIINDAGPIEGIENGAGPTEAIDLNKTPAQKPKKKKHRPKVLKEKKPSKSPKSATPKPSKANEEKPSGKRKYVRRTPAGQTPPEKVADSKFRAELTATRRCLSFDGEVLQENAHPGSQAQVTEISTDSKDYQPSISSTSQRNVQNQLACHVGSATSSIYSSSNQMTNSQLLPADYMPKGVLLDLNSSTNQTQNDHANFVERPSQFFQSRRRETLQANPLLELCAGLPDKSVPDLNSSISQMQSVPTNLAEYFLSSSQASLRETQMANEMLNGHRMLENPVTTSHCFERGAVGNMNPNPCSREAVVIDQMLHSYQLMQNPISTPTHIVGHSVMQNLNEPVAKSDYLNFSLYRQTGGVLGLHDSRDSSHIYTKGTRRSHNACNGAQISLDVNFNHQNNGWASVDACHAASSQASYFPETYKRMRTDNHINCPNGPVGNFSTSSMYVSNNRNENVISAFNSMFTSADAQRLIVHEKSRASQGISSFGSSGNNRAERPEMVQHYRPALHGTPYRHSIEVPDKQFRLITEEFTELPSNPNNLQRENYITRIESHQLQSLEGNMVKKSLLAELHNCSTSAQVDTQNISPSDEFGRSISVEHLKSPITRTNPSTGNDILKTLSSQQESPGEVIRPPIYAINPSAGNDVLQTGNHQVEVSGETTAPSEKRKPGRPRKEVKPSEKPKPRGRPRKEKVVGAELKSKGSHTDPLHAGVTCGATKQNGESFSGAVAPLVDPLDLIIQKIKILDINISHDTVAADPGGALVPYKGEFGAIVPFEGKVKRKRSRAKVDLDPVTNLMWKLLMGPDMIDGAEGMDKDKEKWLDGERKIFQGRVDSFIARMHLVQGDRRFSPWKGSVVDSVVGVFLTQNVSDHLSSSAFMALAAKFPAKQIVSEKPADRMFHTTSEENGGCSGLFGDSVKLQGEILVEEASNNTAGSLVTTEEKEGSNSIGLFGNSPGDGVDCAAGVCYNSYGKLPSRLHEGKLPARTGSVVEAEDGSLEDVVSSQNSAISSQSSPDYPFHMTDHMFSSTLINFAAEDFVNRNMPRGTSIPTTYTELLRMQELKGKSSEKFGPEYHGVPTPLTDKGSVLSDVPSLSSKHQQYRHTSVSYCENGQVHRPDITYASDLEQSACTRLDRMNDSNVIQTHMRFNYPSFSLGIASIDGSLSQDKTSFHSEPTQGADLISPIIDKYFHPLSSETVSFARELLSCEKGLSRNVAEPASVKQYETLNLQEESNPRAKQIGGKNLQSGRSQLDDDVGLQTVKAGNRFSSNLCQNQKANCEVPQGVASDMIEKSEDSKKASPEVPAAGSKAKKARVTGKKRSYDWDVLRKEVLFTHGDKERGQNAEDSINWERIRQADVKEISDTIRERGMNNMLAERIKEFLNRLVRDHGSIDLEWLRYVDPDKAKDYLLSIRGLGLKSVECVRLLTLHHMAFPVDTNVGRICVRLGWVPLQPLPESLQLHLLELYPMLENIQKYLWPRLCKLDQRTLYELHYQMITFGKVFCTKSKPNCNACPMRAECKHFASAFASARLALPGPEEKSLVTSTTPIAAQSYHHTYISSKPANQLEWNAHAHYHVLDNHQPIIEEPASPEPELETAEIKEGAIEDVFIDDPEEIPTIKLNFEEFTQNLKNYMQANNIEIEDADMSKALVAITPEAASIPTPKLKSVSRLRTEHQVYELPDSHPLLEGFDQREPDDPCPYLLSIWTPGETAQSIDAPKSFCNSQQSGKLCESYTCFSCNSIREMEAQKVRGTILIPCRTAMRGSFPLNGTYFQVNEVFADHDSSRNPTDVPRSWIWNLPRRTVYFGTSIPTIFKGLATEDIQHCFWKGFVCVRGFDRISRAPRPLYARLHFPASKIARNKKPVVSAAARDDE